MTDSLIVEETEFPWKIAVADADALLEAPEDVDTMAHRVCLVGELTTWWLDFCRELDDENEDANPFAAKQTAVFVDAAEAYERLAERDDFEDVLEEGLSALDQPTLADLRGTIGYLAPHLGIEIEFPEVDIE